LGHRDHLAAISDPVARQAEFERLVDDLLARGKALNAASFLEFDAVIDPADTRKVLDRVFDAAGPGRPSGRYPDAC
jgi:acetyl-CoA carboxylase carboxyltransferase component